VRNWFYFIVGVIAVISAVTHTVDGLATEIPALSVANLEYMTQSVFVFNYHIVAADHLGIGIALIAMSFKNNTPATKSAAWVVIAISFARVVVSIITVFTTMSAAGSAGTFWIPAIANIVCIVFLLLGTQTYALQKAPATGGINN